MIEANTDEWLLFHVAREEAAYYSQLVHGDEISFVKGREEAEGVVAESRRSTLSD